MMFQPISLEQLRSAGLHPSLDVGALVGSRRWPYFGCHPDAWLRPHQGLILPQNDIRAWTNTIAFSGQPSQTAVNEHVAHLHAGHFLLNEVPVLWTFWDNAKVFWSNVSSLSPAEHDLQNWLRERAAQYQRHATCHLAAAA